MASIFKLSRQVRLGTMCAGTTGFFLVEIIVGYLAKSTALVADSFHMLSDVMSMVVAWYAIKLAARTTRNHKYTYGWQRAEILGALINGIFLLALCFTIVIEAVQKFFEPQNIENPRLVLIVGAVGLAINVFGLFLFHEHSHDHGTNHSQDRGVADINVSVEDGLNPGEISMNAGRLSAGFSNNGNDALRERESAAKSSHMNMRGVFLHIMGDALGSVGVIVSGIVNMYCSGNWTRYVDPVASFGIALILALGTISLVRTAASILLQSTPLGIKTDALKTEITKVEGVLAVHEFHVWQLAEGKSIASVHILIKDPGCGTCNEKSQQIEHTPVDDRTQRRLYMEVASDIQMVLHKYGVHNATIQPEFVDQTGEVVQESNLIADGDEDNASATENTCLLKCVDQTCADNLCCPAPVTR